MKEITKILISCSACGEKMRPVCKNGFVYCRSCGKTILRGKYVKKGNHNHHESRPSENAHENGPAGKQSE